MYSGLQNSDLVQPFVMGGIVISICENSLIQLLHFDNR